MKLGTALLHLQTIELSIIKKRKRINAITRELSDNADVRKAQENMEAIETLLQPLQTQQRDLELQAQGNQEKLTGAEERLYSGNVTKPKELQDMQNEVESLKKWQGELDERTLAVITELEETQAQYDEAKAIYENTIKVAESANTELMAEKDTLGKEVEDLLQQRRDHLPQIDDDVLEIYNKLRKGKSNRPVSTLEDDACVVCGVQQTIVAAKIVRQGEGLTYCSNCKRILVYV